MVECRWERVALGAGSVGIFLPPGWLCAAVAFACSHLVDMACDKLVEAHEGGWGDAGWVEVGYQGWEILGPSLQKSQLGALSERSVLSGHQGRRGYVRARGGGRFEDERETGQPLREGSILLARPVPLT